MKKYYLTIILFLMVLIGAGFGYKLFQHGAEDNMRLANTNISANPAGSVINTPAPQEEIPIGKPVNLEIPKINVSAVVEEVGMDSEGRMDVPKKWQNTAWFNLGYRVGQKGNAVIDGHFDRENGEPAVFYDVNKLKEGDKLIVSTEDGKNLTFTVTKLETFDYDKVPLKELFGPSEIPKLNLITCGGAWDEKAKNYQKRLVVYSELAD